MTKCVCIISVLILFLSINFQSIETDKQDIFLGKFSMKVNNSDNFKDVFEIIKKEEKFYLNDFKNSDKKLIELRSYNIIELNSKLYKAMPKDSKILGNESSFMICKVPKYWSYEDFICETGYFIVTIAGPICVYRN